jgi:hypothetical protein
MVYAFDECSDVFAEMPLQTKADSNIIRDNSIFLIFLVDE